MAAATSAIRKTANALSAEGELRNVNEVLKEYARAHESTVKAQESATKAIITWTERKREDPAIAEFLSAVGDLDAETGAIERQFVDQFRLFIKLWKDVLAEKKELNTKITALKKARTVLDTAQKKVQRAELRDPPEPDKLVKYRAALAEASAGEQEATAAVAQKLFDCQADKHQSLRTGYTGLYTASMTRLRELTLVQEKVRSLINSFPQVVKRNEDGSFVLKPYDGASVRAPVWWQGEKLSAELEALKKSHTRELDALHQKHSTALSELAKEREQMHVRTSQTWSSELESTESRHRSLMQSMQTEHAQQLATAQQKLDAAIKKQEDDTADLENRLSLMEAELQQRNQELLGHISDETRLEEQIVGLKKSFVASASKHASGTIAACQQLVPHPAVENLQRQCASLKTAANEAVALVKPEADYAAQSAAVLQLGAVAPMAIVSAASAARVSKAENSAELLVLAEELGQACSALSSALQSAFANPGRTSSPPPEEDTAPEGMEWYVALYDHDAKIHQGISLVGFKKGDLLLLEKKRDDGWSKVRIGDITGWAPTSYIKEKPKGAKPAAASSPEQGAAQALVAKIDAVVAFAAQMAARDKELDALHNAVADDIGSRVSATQQSIIDALSHVEKLRTKSAAEDKGRQLEVNQNVLQRVREMLETLAELVTAADNMRTALKASQGKATDEEFNRKHSAWFQALTHAVDAAVDGNALLTEALRCVVARRGKHEELQVATRGIAAAVAQLASLSRTKTLPTPDPAQELVDTRSQSVIALSHEVLAATRESQEIELASVLMENLEDLSDHDAKKLLMSTQVKVLKLESDLTREREKLGALRRRTHVESGLSEA
eukprot:m.486307 g.486307  ORF g.486307 m.486307 type:complete len:845 (+) comp24307_c0_seq1:460-2994(+)